MRLTQISARPVPSAAQALQEDSITPVLARIFAARGVQRSSELRNDLAELPPFDSLKGIGAAADRLARAIREREPVLIIADYDADGATACAVGMLGLSAMGARVDYLVPNRFEFGYGLTPEIVALAAQRKPRIIVTVDNGIASVDGVAAANALGIEVIVTDHHLPGEQLPAADIETGRVAGRLNALSVSYTARVMLWNLGTFERLKLALPRTWDDLFASGPVFRRALGEGAFPLDGELYDMLLLAQTWVQQKHGTAFIAPDAPRVAMDEAAALDWVRTYQRLVGEHVATPLPLRDCA